MVDFQVAPARPHRPEAQDVALSRPKHGFESRWGRDPLRNDQPIQESIEFHPAAEGIESFVSPRRPRDAAVEELRRALRVNGIKR